MSYSVTGSYGYNALCDVCKFQFKASELRLRWDNLMVCKWDWEPRHPSDFYRNRKDAHQLPFTRPNFTANPELSWPHPTPTESRVVVTLATGEVEGSYTNAGSYIVNALSGLTTGKMTVVYFVDANTGFLTLPDPKSHYTASIQSAAINLPTTAGGAGTASYSCDGEFITSVAISAGDTVTTIKPIPPGGGQVPAFAKPLILNVSYIT